MGSLGRLLRVKGLFLILGLPILIAYLLSPSDTAPPAVSIILLGFSAFYAVVAMAGKPRAAIAQGKRMALTEAPVRLLFGSVASLTFMLGTTSELNGDAMLILALACGAVCVALYLAAVGITLFSNKSLKAANAEN